MSVLSTELWNIVYQNQVIIETETQKKKIGKIGESYGQQHTDFASSKV